MLRRTYAALSLIGVPEVRLWAILEKIALDSIPKLRGEIVSFLRAQRESGRESVTSGRVAKVVKSAHSSTRRALEELRAHGLLTEEEEETEKGKAYLWKFSDFGKELLDIGFSTVPEKSDTPHTPQSSKKNLNFSDTVPDDYSGTVAENAPNDGAAAQREKVTL